MYEPDHFWCEGCGTDRPYDDAVNEIIDGEALCYRCNHQLEKELTQGCPQQPITAPGPDGRLAAVNSAAKELLTTAESTPCQNK